MLKPMDRNSFAEAVRGSLIKSGYAAELRYDPKEFALIENDSNKVFLVNAYAEHCASPFWKRKANLQAFVDSFVQMQTLRDQQLTPEQARRQLRPYLRVRSIQEDQRLGDKITGKTGRNIPFRLVGEHLTLELVQDTPKTIGSVNEDDLESWGLSFDEAMDIARTNLAQSSPPRFRTVRPGLYQSEFGDYYDAARMVLPDFIPNLPVKGRPVAMVPNRTVLLVTGADDPEGLVEMAKLASQVLKQPRPITGFAFRFDASWTPFLPPAEHPAHLPLSNLALDSISEAYASQKTELEKAFQEIGRDIFVASVMRMADKTTGRQDTIGVWSKGVLTLLPETTLVGFMHPIAQGGSSDTPLLVPWGTAKETVGHLMEPQGYYPERYLVKEFPSPEQLTAMAAYAVV